MSIKGIIKGIAFMAAASVVIGLLPFSYSVNAAVEGITLSGTCHVQDVGDCEGTWDASTGTLTLGTRGQSRRLEAITINMENTTGVDGSLEYRTHVENIGWQDYVSAGTMAGTAGQSLRIEGIEIRLTGDLAAVYSVEYQAHIQDYGDSQGFVSDGLMAGTEGQSRRVEELQIRIVPRNAGTSMGVKYHTHIQNIGWETDWKTDGAPSGTTGQCKRIEAIEMFLTGGQYEGSILYHSHVQNVGWEGDWASDGEMSGSLGKSQRLEAIEIKLEGDVANYYDVYYRVHVQNIGWMGWAKNGEMAGTSRESLKIESIQIVLTAKDSGAPGDLCGITSVRSEACEINDGPEVLAAPPEPSPYPDVDAFAQNFSSKTNYLILVDRGACMVYIYQGSQGNWNAVQYYTCCVGKKSTPTITGSYTLGSKGLYFNTQDGHRCWYFSIIHGNYYFHSVLYDRSPAPVNVVDGTLGAQVSHGCIRLALEDSKWIYDNIPAGTTVYIYN